MASTQIYGSELRSIQQVVRLTADRIFLKDALRSGQTGRAAAVLRDVLRQEQLDVLVVTNAEGRVLLRPANPARVGDDRAADPLLQAVRDRRRGGGGDRRRASERVAARGSRAGRAHVRRRRSGGQTDSADAGRMMLVAAAPVVDGGDRLLGLVYGGVLLDGRNDLVDRIKQGVFQDAQYEEKSVGAATLFLRDVRIATTVRNADGTRALGTRIGAEIYQRVVLEGRPWVAPTFAVSDWYLAAYAPLRSISGEKIGMLGVGLLEAPYLDLKRRSTLMFLGITLAGTALTIGLSYVISQRFSVPLRNLVAASQRLARGDLAAKVPTPAVTEFAELAQGFNAMADALRARDEKLREFTRRKIMESERLAVIGQLAAGVAHELNNPLQGIVAYSHLLREKKGAGNGGNGSDAWVEKIVTQADRCTTIVRGLLDFARPRTPVMKADGGQRAGRGLHRAGRGAGALPQHRGRPAARRRTCRRSWSIRR